MKGTKKTFKNIIYKKNKLKQALKQNNSKPITLETFAQSNKNLKLKNQHKNKSMSEKKKTIYEAKELLSKSIEIDYLNFSQMIIDENELIISNSNSFTRLEYEYNKRINNRYEDCESSLNSIEIEDQIKKKNNDELIKTPSTVCNYYTNSELTSSIKVKDNNNHIRKNLNKIYNQMHVEKDKKENKSYIQKEKNYKKIPNKVNQQKKGMTFLNVNKNKLFEDKKNKTLISNLKKNNSRQKRDKSKKEEKKNNTNSNFYHGISLFNNYINSPFNTKKVKNNNNLNFEKDKRKIIKSRTASMDCLKHNSKISSTSGFNNYNNSTLKVNQNNSLNHNLINNKKVKNKHNQQKPITLCFDQMKYDNYFITPTNNNKTLEGKRKSLTNNKLKKNMINNFSYKNSNKSASAIKVETKYHNKSASFCNVNKNNSNKTNEKKLKSSQSLNKLTNNVKIKSHNPLKISKTLTEKTILNIIQKTPKNSKMSFLSSISSLQKTNYNSSAKTQKVLPFENYSNIKIYSNFSVFKVNKSKTQSELKQKKYLNFGSGNSKNNNNYNNLNNNQNNNNSNFEKNVKQKLIDRMNNAMKNNWNYLYPHQENESKKILIQDISEIIQTPNKDNYFENSNSENKGRNDENNSDLKDNMFKNLQKYIIPSCQRINDDEDFFSIKMNEKK